MKSIATLEYIWLDGTQPVQALRSKTRLLPYEDELLLKDLPQWSFDGSSTNQAKGGSSDCLLNPVYLCINPLRGEASYFVMCEVMIDEKTPHATNARAVLRKLMDKGGEAANIRIGFEQEYILLKNDRPLGWPDSGFPEPQGPFYCGVGTNKVSGRDVVEEHMEVCIAAGLNFFGINAEVLLGQWEFQMGYRGDPAENANPLHISDQMWIARYLLELLTESYDIKVSFDNKPIHGNWNGSGMHTNISTEKTSVKGGYQSEIIRILKNLEKNHKKDILDYGHGLKDRLTGGHETCDINTFNYGESDRGAAVRIPMGTVKNNAGYFEDRRPGANADPYKVSACLVRAIL